MLVYISILVLVSGGALTLLFSLSDRMAEQRANQLVTRASESALERILNEIRTADSVDVFYSTLESTPGVLTLVDGATTTEFSLSGNTVVMEVNGGVQAPLTDERVSVGSLRFFMYDNTVTEMVRVVLTLSATSSDATTITKTFTTGATLRGSYD